MNKTIMLTLLGLMLLVGSALAQPQGFTGILGGTLPETDPTDQFLKLFGIPVEFFGWSSAFIFLATVALKERFKTSGWITDVIAGVIALCLSLKALYPDPISIIACTVALWALPSGSYLLVKKLLIDKATPTTNGGQ